MILDTWTDGLGTYRIVERAGPLGKGSFRTIEARIAASDKWHELTPSLVLIDRCVELRKACSDLLRR